MRIIYVSHYGWLRSPMEIEKPWILKFIVLRDRPAKSKVLSFFVSLGHLITVTSRNMKISCKPKTTKMSNFVLSKKMFNQQIWIFSLL